MDASLLRGRLQVRILPGSPALSIATDDAKGTDVLDCRMGGIYRYRILTRQCEPAGDPSRSAPRSSEVTSKGCCEIPV